MSNDRKYLSGVSAGLRSSISINSSSLYEKQVKFVICINGTYSLAISKNKKAVTKLVKWYDLFFEPSVKMSNKATSIEELQKLLKNNLLFDIIENPKEAYKESLKIDRENISQIFASLPVPEHPPVPAKSFELLKEWYFEVLDIDKTEFLKTSIDAAPETLNTLEIELIESLILKITNEYLTPSKSKSILPPPPPSKEYTLKVVATKTFAKWLEERKSDLQKSKNPFIEKVKDDNSNSRNKFYTDEDFQKLLGEMLNLDLIRINDFLDYHFSNSFGNSTINNINWLTMLRKHLLWIKREAKILNNADHNIKLEMASKWEENKTVNITTEVNKRTNAVKQKNPQQTLDELKKMENLFWKGMPIETVINHFNIMTEKKSKNGNPFLTSEQLISFIQRAFLKDKQQPKQKINFAIGEKGFTIKRFYEFFDLAVTQYAEVNKTEKYINLVLNNFDNMGTFASIKSYFKSNKTKEKWE